MGSSQLQDDIPLPKGWTRHVRCGIVHAVSLAGTALTLASGRAARSRGRHLPIVELRRAA